MFAENVFLQPPVKKKKVVIIGDILALYFVQHDSASTSSVSGVGAMSSAAPIIPLPLR